MQRSLVASIGVSLALVTSPAAAPGQSSSQSAAPVAFAREASIRALTFRQGDQRAFAGIEALFTSDGWTEFVKTLQGFRDSNGAPTFSSTFAPAGEGRIVDERDGVVHVRIPGTLTQQNQASKTTYRIAADVWAGMSPQLVHRLTQTTCLGGSKACD